MDELMSVAKIVNYNRICQRYYSWKNQPSSVGTSLPTLSTNLKFPKISGKKQKLSDKDKQEMKVRRMMRNRESAARSRARKLAFIKELQNKVFQLEALIKSLGRNKERHQVSQEEVTAPQLRRTNSAPR